MADIIPTFSINGAPKRTGKLGQSLKEALREAGVMMPSVCGGRGLCGMCRAKVEGDATPFTPAELKHLSEEEKTGGVRLSCQVNLTGHLNVTVPDAVLEAGLKNVEVSAKEQLNYDTVKLSLSFEKGDGLAFTAGQYVQLGIPPHDGLNETVYRAYSIASPPQVPDSVDLIIRRVPKGIATGFIHDQLKVGDKLELNGPFGGFKLRNTTNHAIFLAGGSGVAPFLSILADAGQRKIDKPITFLFGGVSRQDLYLLDRIRELGSAIPGFTFVPILSNPRPEDNWEGEVGLVTEVALRLFPTMEGMEAYLCGSPGMIDACVKCMTNRGISPSKIFFDKFG